jgi:Mg-chelatase subunit ChlI
MKTALILNAVDPAIGGVLIRGQKGTGKTTAVRSLQSVLPKIRVVKGCPYRCSPDEPENLHGECKIRADKGIPLEVEEIPTPLVDLPLNATEDRLVGTLQIEEALRSGTRRFEPGLLAAANRGILYIDEVNLLEDHLVDMLLDAAATGVNLVEREGLSYSHPSRFMLVGTMNPEEGELRPQFLDRFGLCVVVTGVSGEGDRLAILRRRMAFERSPEAFAKVWEGENRVLAAQIVRARSLLPNIALDDAALELIVRIASDAGTAGHRAEIAMMKTAAALAAFTESDRVLPFHVHEAARLVLPHRMNLGSLNGADAAADRIDALVRAARGHMDQRGGGEPAAEDFGAPGEEPGQGAEDHYSEPSGEYAEEYGVDPATLEEMQVPGPTASGSIIFTFLKKKLPTAEASRKT